MASPSSKPIQLCMLSHASGLYGAEVAMIELIKALQTHGIKTHVLVPREGPLLKSLLELGIPFQVVPFRWWVARNVEPIRRLGRGLWRIVSTSMVMRAIRQIEAQIVYTNTIAILDGALAAHFMRLPHVWHIHEYGMEDHGLRFDLGAQLSTYIMKRLSNCVIANSQVVARKYARYIPREKISVIYQSVIPRGGERPAWLSSNGSAFRFAVLGYLQKEKGQHIAIEAAAILSSKGIPIELWIIGSGDPQYELSLRKLSRAHAIEDRVRFTGYINAPQRLLIGMDALVVCTAFEAFGRTTIEGMLAGKPVVGANSGCTAELISDGETGLLYESGNAADLAEKLALLQRSPAMAKLIGEKAKHWAEEGFTMERYGAEVAEILKDLVR
jgi:glycosyltransferase involved in cell wall biosynthesis